ncbi:MAG: hypothetical protein Q8O00_01440 [Holophaga sp.]|nr:hypothetical protein [Holophaga sp.]
MRPCFRKSEANGSSKISRSARDQTAHSGEAHWEWIFDWGNFRILHIVLSGLTQDLPAVVLNHRLHSPYERILKMKIDESG